jgi:site-specific DNA-methyltransferase (adenine-specific)
VSEWIIHEGDCLAVMATLPDCSVDAVICDPPYGTTACKWDSVIPFAPMWEQLKRVAKPRAAIVLFGSQPFTSALVMSNPGMFKYTWVWEKNVPTGFLNAKKQPMRWHEDISVFYRQQPTYNPQYREGVGYHVKVNSTKSQNYGQQRNITSINDGTHYFPRDILRFDNHNGGGKDHPTQKPVTLMEYLIRTYTNEGDTVLDFTCGSGSTGVACVNTDRHFIGIENHPPYVTVARRRIADAAAQPRLAGVA